MMKRKIQVFLALSVVMTVVLMVTRVYECPVSQDNIPLSLSAGTGLTREKELQQRTAAHLPENLPQNLTPSHSPVRWMSSRGQIQQQKGSDSTERSKAASLNPTSSENAGWGEYPDWWLRAWPRSAVSGSEHLFAGDIPLFPPCTTSHPASMLPFVKPKDYLTNSKNPCWYDRPSAKKGLRCVPYVYLAGVAKCGTTDLARRLRKHPQIFHGTHKEYHWWERFRFGSFDPQKPDETIDKQGGMPFRQYLDEIVSDGIEDLEEELATGGSSRRIFGDYSPSYLWDPHNWYVLDGNQGCLEPRVIVAQHIYHMYPQAKIILTFRHPTPRLYSRFLSRIHRTPFLKKATVEDFHRYVSDGIKTYMKCFEVWSIRHCAYSLFRYDESQVRLVEGMYPVFMADWLRVWPRDQIFLLRYEDYGGHVRERMQELFDFLELDPVNKTQMDDIADEYTSNSGSEEYKKYGSMLPETRKLLDDFYQPFVLQFAQMLNDKRFLWRDVYQ